MVALLVLVALCTHAYVTRQPWKLKHAFPEHANWVSSVGFSSQSNEMVTLDHDMPGVVRVWGVDSFNLIACFRDESIVVESAVFSPRSDHLLIVGERRTGSSAEGAPTAVVVSVPDGKRAELPGAAEAVFTCDQQVLVVAEDDGRIRVFKVQGSKMQEVVADGVPSGIAIASCPVRPLVVYGDLSDGGKLWALDFGKKTAVRARKLSIPQRVRENTEMFAPGVISVSFSPNGKWIAAATESNHVCLWDAESFTFAACWLQGDEETGFAQREDLVCYLNAQGVAVVADVPFQRSRVRMQGGYSRLRSLRLAPNSKAMAAVSGVGTVHIWDASSGKELFRWQASTAEVHELRWSKDGRFIATAGSGQRVALWERCFPEWWWGQLARPSVLGATMAGALACMALFFRKRARNERL